jgi:hypothetical protein
MDNMKQMMQELLGGMEERINASQKKAEADRDELKVKMDSYQEKAEASMVKLEKIEETMEDYGRNRATGRKRTPATNVASTAIGRKER